MDEGEPSAWPEDAPGLAQQGQGFLGMQDIVEHRVIDTVRGQPGAFRHEIAAAHFDVGQSIPADPPEQPCDQRGIHLHRMNRSLGAQGGGATEGAVTRAEIDHTGARATGAAEGSQDAVGVEKAGPSLLGRHA